MFISSPDLLMLFNPSGKGLVTVLRIDVKSIFSGISLISSSIFILSEHIDTKSSDI